MNLIRVDRSVNRRAASRSDRHDVREPPTGQTPSGVDAGEVVMGDVVEKDQTRLVETVEVEQVEAGRQLLDAVAIAAQVEPQPVRDQQTVGRLVRDDED